MFSLNLKLALLGLVSASATITLGGCASSGRAGREEQEVAVTLDQLPQPVRDTLTREAPDGIIEDIERETAADGSVVYSIDTKIAGKVYDLEIAPDGRLISRDLD